MMNYMINTRLDIIQDEINDLNLDIKENIDINRNKYQDLHDEKNNLIMMLNNPERVEGNKIIAPDRKGILHFICFFDKRFIICNLNENILY